jgi:hypothetical protein
MEGISGLVFIVLAVVVIAAFKGLDWLFPPRD